MFSMSTICFLREQYSWEKELEADLAQILFSPQILLELFERYLRAVWKVLELFERYLRGIRIVWTIHAMTGKKMRRQGKRKWSRNRKKAQRQSLSTAKVCTFDSKPKLKVFCNILVVLCLLLWRILSIWGLKWWRKKMWMRFWSLLAALDFTRPQRKSKTPVPDS